MNIVPEISIILPCRNEEAALPLCLTQIKNIIAAHKLSAEIIVSDSSADNSPTIAQNAGVTLIKHDMPGYGNAYLKAFGRARGQYLFMADPDGSYNFAYIPQFIAQLKKGYDMVIGNRLAGPMEPKAMRWTNRYVGIPLLSFLLRIFFGVPATDSQCGMRAITKEALDRLQLKTPGMEFASEMLIKARRQKLTIQEMQVSYHQRQGISKLRPWRDGLRHLYCMAMHIFI